MKERMEPPSSIKKILSQMRTAPRNVRYEDARKVGEHYFGSPRQNATSHCVFKTPWPGDPRVNIQRGKDGKAKAYQIKQILAAIDRLSSLCEDNTDEP